MPKNKRSSDDIFQVFRSMKTQHPITQFAMATACVTDIQRFEFIEAVINSTVMKGNKQVDFSKFKTVNAIIRNRFEQGVVRDLKKNMDIVGRGGLLAANIRKQRGEPEDEEMEQNGIDAE
jgi:hypothetical protein